MDFKAYLRSERLFTAEPYQQENLLPKIKLISTPKKVVFDNFYRVSKGKIFCHICGGHRHQNGITGLINEGDRVLFGSSCAKDFFGSEVHRLCAGDLRNRTKRAHDRFLISSIVNSVEPVILWLKSYKGLVNHIERSWVIFYERHERAIPELLAHLARNSGRLVQTSHITIGGEAKPQEHLTETSILTHISNVDSFPYLRQLNQRAALVDSFIQAVSSIKNQPNEQMFSNLAAFYQRTLDAAQIIDSSISFTSEFFQAEKFRLLTKWMENARRNRLRNLPNVTQQNLASNMRDVMGFGIERPATLLTQALQATQITDKLNKNNKKREIKEIIRL